MNSNLQLEIKEYEELYAQVNNRGKELLNKYLHSICEQIIKKEPFNLASFFAFDLESSISNYGSSSEEQLNLHYSIYIPAVHDINPDSVIGTLCRVNLENNHYWKISFSSLYQGPAISIPSIFFNLNVDSPVVIEVNN